MSFLESFAVEHASWLLFLNVFLEQLGVPVPAYPSLLVAGALSLTAVVNTPAVVLLLGVLACVLADSLWYLAGRRYGNWMMSRLCKVSLTPDTCIRKNTGLYVRVGPRILLIAKFLPGASALSTLMAGTVGTSYRRFLFYDLCGSALWVGSALLLGILFKDAVQLILGLASQYVAPGVAVVLAALALFLFWRWWQRHTLLRRSAKVPRMTVDALMALQEAGEDVLVIDVRGPQASGEPIPGAIVVELDHAQADFADIDTHEHIVIYCACPNEISAALLGERIKKVLGRETYALLGGYDAWTSYNASGA